MNESPLVGNGPCLLCGAVDDPTVEHVIPQTLWNRFGIDPNQSDLAQFRTDLCGRHNRATSALHRRTEVMDLIEQGEPVSVRTLQLLADWAVWVTLLLGLARGRSVLGASESRALLLERFASTQGGGPPKGVRVYAARVSDYVEASTTIGTQYALALVGDPRIALDAERRPQGISVNAGSINASESIGLGKIALLVVGRSYKSGPDHEHRLDAVVGSVGLERIWPPSDTLPTLDPRPVSITEVSRIFTTVPFGDDASLAPSNIRVLLGLERAYSIPSAPEPD
ncbi:hypothetical protein [Nesterenkonia jeotgali]|uniref:hypothetical protein n=1 Tax=Nesterenkonia jeotgali TaxID=317018 RepID=UPI000A78DCF8|nr:hypothetical protein [Nesterenkonia jeotgali]